MFNSVHCCSWVSILLIWPLPALEETAQVPSSVVAEYLVHAFPAFVGLNERAYIWFEIL